ncbi:MAG: M23 family metallopeptidase [Herpetosiphon sp.]|nr:M23 family metallopeptidase [Herpetosiphon sp.]
MNLSHRLWLVFVVGSMLVACASQTPSTSVPTSVAQIIETTTPSSVPTLIPTLEPTTTPQPTNTTEPTATPEPPTQVPPTPIPPTKAPVVLSHVFPVRPASAVQFGSCHHDYPASDMFTPTGSEFVAVTSGVIDYVTYEDKWDPATDNPAIRGGLSVAMIGDDGVRYYGSHLSAIADGIAPGVRVNAGDLLGLTGNSGDARSTPPHVHFGISPPTTPEDWSIRRGTINPYPYLLRWLDGENATPDLNDPPSGAC